MKNKGLTVVELLAVFILLGVIALIAVPATSKIKRESAESAFKESAKGIITAAQSYYAENNYENYPSDGMEVLDKRLKIKNQNSYDNGIILYNSAVGQFELQLLTDGNFCANGTLDDMIITSGNCQTKESCFTFNKTTQTIESYDFFDETCPNNIVIPESIQNTVVKHIGNDAFIDKTEALYCSSDNFVTVNEVEGGHIRNDEKCVMKSLYDEAFYETNIRSVSLPATIETIGENAFAGSNIKILNLVKNTKLKSISSGAFMGSKKLQTVELPSSNIVEIIDAYSFADTSIKEINFNKMEELLYIGSAAFTNTSISNVDLSNSNKLKYIGNGAFYNILSANPILNLGNKTKMEFLGEFAFCSSGFRINGWTNIDNYLSYADLEKACIYFEE